MLIELRDHADLEQLFERSKTNPVLIFKHSTQCPVSFAAYDEFERFVEDTRDITCGVVLVIEDRDISDRIESDLGIRHESPQAIVVQNGRSTWNASHWSITADALNKAIRG